MVAPIIAALLAANAGATAISALLGLGYHGWRAGRNADKIVKEFQNPEGSDIVKTVQKKIEEFDWSKIPKSQPVAYYGTDRPNIKTLGGRSVLYDGNRSMSRWLWK